MFKKTTPSIHPNPLHLIDQVDHFRGKKTTFSDFWNLKLTLASLNTHNIRGLCFDKNEEYLYVTSKEIAHFTIIRLKDQFEMSNNLIL